jgi:hypothetical protein
LGCAPGVEGDLDEASSALEAPTLVFAGDFTQRATGPLTAGSTVQVRYDLSRLTACRGTMYGREAWGVTGFWRLNAGEPRSFALSDNGAPVTATLSLPAAPGTLELWFQNNNRWGCNAYDSAYGANYRFAVGAPARAPGWVGNGVSVIARQTCDAGPCDSDRRPLAQGFRYDTWARQRAAIRVLSFDVWKAGVTDRDNPSLWQELDVQLRYRFGSTGEFARQYVRFDRRVGNDARYTLDLRGLDPMPDAPATTACPPGLTRSADRQTVETAVEYYFTVNGTAYRPDGGGVFRGVFANYASAVPARCVAP